MVLMAHMNSWVHIEYYFHKLEGWMEILAIPLEIEITAVVCAYIID